MRLNQIWHKLLILLKSQVAVSKEEDVDFKQNQAHAFNLNMQPKPLVMTCTCEKQLKPQYLHFTPEAAQTQWTISRPQLKG